MTVVSVGAAGTMVTALSVTEVKPPLPAVTRSVMAPVPSAAKSPSAKAYCQVEPVTVALKTLPVPGTVSVTVDPAVTVPPMVRPVRSASATVSSPATVPTVTAGREAPMVSVVAMLLVPPAALVASMLSAPPAVVRAVRSASVRRYDQRSPSTQAAWLWPPMVMVTVAPRSTLPARVAPLKPSTTDRARLSETEASLPATVSSVRAGVVPVTMVTTSAPDRPLTSPSAFVALARNWCVPGSSTVPV